MRIMWLKKIAVKIEKKQSSIFTYPVKKQKAYIKHFPEPKDELERSHFQYRCQMKLYGAVLYTALNLASLPLAVALLCKYKARTSKADRSAQCIFIQNGLPENIIPDSLREQYLEILSVAEEDHCLTKSDIAFLKTVFKRYPFSWMFWLKTIIKISQYSSAIQQYSPDAILSCDEFSYTSSAVTAYCRSKGIRRINVMHGEKLYYMRDSFVEYDAYYVWNSHYVDLLVALRAKAEQFRVELPPAMRIQRQNAACIHYDYTFYLQNESEQTLKVIATALRALYDKGNRISVRPHPRYSDMQLVSKLLDFADIEDNKTVTIQQSLLQTGAVVSLFSTVLNQAVSNGIPIVIDDIGNPTHYKKLKQLRYICLYKEHKLLSELIGEL